MAPALADKVTNWADDDAGLDVPKIESSVDANGIITTVEYSTNEDGKKVKITRRIKRTLRTSQVSHAVAERKATWQKFGAEKGKKAGPDSATTTVAENIRVKLTAGNKSTEVEADDKSKLRDQLEGKKIKCRLCQGNHFTSRCPHKDTLGGMDEDGGDGIDADADPALAAAAAGGSGKYIPPSLRDPLKRGAGETMYGRGGANRDDMPTLRVTNLSEDVTEPDLWDLFGHFGRISRIFVGRDQETGLCKGFAFVSFEEKSEAEKAMGRINGLPYDHLILQCGWSVPREARPERG